jgi:general L-amino acid transport system permease protein
MDQIMHSTKRGQSTAYLYGQILGYTLLLGAIAVLVMNFNHNAKQLDTELDWSFLALKSGFGITQKWLAHHGYHSNLNVLLVGLMNTIVVSILSIVASSVIGAIVAMGATAKNIVLQKTAAVYVNIFRNVPLLIQILFWYNLWVTKLPTVKQTTTLFSIAINNRGIYLPSMQHHEMVYVLFAAGTVLHLLLLRAFQYRKVASVAIARYNMLPLASLTTAVIVFLFVAISGLQGALTPPVIGRFNVSGFHIYPEFIALFFGLTFYTAAYNAESIRGAILAVPAGQQEVAESLSLSPWQSFTTVILPQSIPGFIPPLASHYVNVAKNSSLGLSVGYPELFAIFAGTVLNQTGRATEIIAIIMLVYLMLSAVIITIMNWVNRKQSHWAGGQVQ